MRRLALVLLASVALIAGCSSAPAEYVSHYTQPPDAPKVAAVAIIGDSYTGGTDLGGHGPQGWPALVASRLRTQSPINTELGTEGGSGYATAGPRGGTFVDEIPKAVKPYDRLVVLFGGLNDAKVSPDVLAPAVQRTLAAVKAAAPAAKIILVGPPAWPYGDPMPGVLQVRDVLKDQAQQVGAMFVDPIADGWFVDRPDLIGSDGIHPTDEGHAYMADRITPVMAQMLTN